jgi:16S rRNA (guanine966-N2)-methyltransferase
MRIISGKYRGRQLQIPKGLPVRPTTDRTKEALFNVLNNQIYWEDTDVLDLFSGTGNISYESWSRGAKSVTSVDQNGKCVATIKRLMKDLGIAKPKVIKMNVWQYVKTCNDQYDFIFMDPPYAMPRQEELVSLIFERNLLKPEGLLVVEHTTQLAMRSLPCFQYDKIYGSSTLSFFSNPENI